MKVKSQVGKLDLQTKLEPLFRYHHLLAFGQGVQTTGIVKTSGFTDFMCFQGSRTGIL